MLNFFENVAIFAVITGIFMSCEQLIFKNVTNPILYKCLSFMNFVLWFFISLNTGYIVTLLVNH